MTTEQLIEELNRLAVRAGSNEQVEAAVVLCTLAGALELGCAPELCRVSRDFNGRHGITRGPEVLMRREGKWPAEGGLTWLQAQK